MNENLFHYHVTLIHGRYVHTRAKSARQILHVLAHGIQFQLVMKLSNPFSRRPTEELIAHAVTFVGEQDGPPERMLKGKLSELFAGCKNPKKAYLARVHYREAKGESVCLCLSVSGGDEKPLVEAVHSLFAQQFNRAVHLDILFLNPKQEEQLAAICKPFYRREPVH